MSYKEGDVFDVTDEGEQRFLKALEGSVISGAILIGGTKIPLGGKGMEWVVENEKVVLKKMSLEEFMKLRSCK